MSTCKECKQPLKNPAVCHNCRRVFICPSQSCATVISSHKLSACPRCGLLFPDYLDQQKKVRECPKCKRKQGLTDPQCHHCHYWFNCPSCGHKVPSTSMLTCPRCATSLR